MAHSKLPYLPCPPAPCLDTRAPGPDAGPQPGDTPKDGRTPDRSRWRHLPLPTTVPGGGAGATVVTR